MLKKIIYILLVLCVTSEVVAQKSMEKIWDAVTIDTLIIDSDLLSLITILSSPLQDTIVLGTKVEGEFYESVVINSSISERTLNISTDFKPYHQQPNDKLAAHKLLAVEMILSVPTNISIVIRSQLANVECFGRYTYFEVALGDGSCWLDAFSGNAQLYTMDGNIYTTVLQGVSGNAVSEFGDVENELQPNGWYKVNAESKFGSIFLRSAPNVKNE